MANLAMVIVAFLLFREDSSSHTIHVAAFASVGGAAGGLLGGFAANSAQMLLTLKKNSGVCSVHDFALSPTELYERAAVNASPYKWSGMQSVVKLRSYILVYINNHTVYVMARRSFASNAEFDAFFEQAAAFWQLAQQSARSSRTSAAEPTPMPDDRPSYPK